MSQLAALVEDFLAQKRIAVVGVSNTRDSGCNLVYSSFKAQGYQVSAVNPNLSTFKGDPCYPDLKSIPETPDAVFILSNPKVTEQIVQQCIDLGVKHVWMHCLMGTRPGLGVGTSSVSQQAVQLCRQNGIAVIPGACPLQFSKSDPGHALMRVVFGLLGFHRITAQAAPRNLP
jgi:predicted CoA-binding protein